jgi:hypothetical protein
MATANDRAADIIEQAIFSGQSVLAGINYGDPKN